MKSSGFTSKGEEEAEGRERPSRTREELEAIYGPAGIMREVWNAKKGPGEVEAELKEAVGHLEEGEERKGRQIALVCTVGFLVVAGGVSVGAWEFFKQEAETIRNLVLLWGAPLALGLAVWRGIVSQRQAAAAEKGVLNARYQSAIEMLGNERAAVRVGGIHALRDMGVAHPQYSNEVEAVLRLYARGKTWRPTMQNNELGIKIPADEWEAEQAAAVVYEAGKRRGRQTGL